MMYPILLKLFFVVGMASAILAISLVLFSSVFFDKRGKLEQNFQEAPVKDVGETKILDS